MLWFPAMTQNSDHTETFAYPEYLIRAIDDETAAAFAEENGFEDGSWFRLPSSLDDTTEAFKREATPTLSSEEYRALDEETRLALSLENVWNDRILFAKNLQIAAEYAAQRQWWLHAWKLVASPELGEEVIEYGFYC